MPFIIADITALLHMGRGDVVLPVLFRGGFCPGGILSVSRFSQISDTSDGVVLVGFTAQYCYFISVQHARRSFERRKYTRQDAVLSQGKLRDAAVNFDSYRIL